jgi:dTDP-4-dehydrorhamnose reductase
MMTAIITTMDYVVNCAAYTNVDKAESERFLAYQINCLAMKYLGMMTNYHKIPLVHISTDYVFDGTIGNYNEQSETNPINVYGKTKLEGEQMLIDHNPDSMILRVQWTYGKNGNHFIDKILKNCMGNPVIKVVDDQFGAPTSVDSVSNAIVNMLENPQPGTYHFSASGKASRYDVAQFILDSRIKNGSIELVRCKTTDFKSPAMRPLDTSFNCSKISGIWDVEIEPWQNDLDKYLNNDK